MRKSRRAFPRLFLSIAYCLLSRSQAWGHGILAQGVNGLYPAILSGHLIDAAGLGVVAIGNSDGLCGAFQDGVGPGAVMVAGASHAVGLADLKFFHSLFLSGPMACRCISISQAPTGGQEGLD